MIVAMNGYTTITSSQRAPGRRNSKDPRWLLKPPPPACLVVDGRMSPTGAGADSSAVETATATLGPHHSAGDATSADVDAQPASRRSTNITHWYEYGSAVVAFRGQEEY